MKTGSRLSMLMLLELLTFIHIRASYFNNKQFESLPDEDTDADDQKSRLELEIRDMLLEERQLLFEKLLRAGERCPSGFVYRAKAKSCYKVIMHMPAVVQASAVSQCKTYDSKAHLVFIESKEEQEDLLNLLETVGTAALDSEKIGHVYVWTGGCRKSVQGTKSDFVWSTGCAQSQGPTANSVQFPMNYTNWAPNMPDNSQIGSGGEWCVHVYLGDTPHGAGLTWNDENCNSAYIHAAICETNTI